MNIRANCSSNIKFTIEDEGDRLFLRGDASLCVQKSVYPNKALVEEIYGSYLGAFEHGLNVVSSDVDYWSVRYNLEARFKYYDSTPLLQISSLILPGEVLARDYYINKLTSKDVYVSGCGAQGKLHDGLSYFRECSSDFHLAGIENKYELSKLYASYLSALKEIPTEEMRAFFVEEFGEEPSPKEIV